MGSNKFHLPAAGLFLLLSAIFAACSGDSSTQVLSAKNGVVFWAADFSKDVPTAYQVNAAKAGEGAHCYIYLEEGAEVSRESIDAIIREFDITIYPVATTIFGSEPIPGADSDSKIYVMLLNIRDGYNGTSKPSYIAGYFDPGNEYPGSSSPFSNEKEMLYMDINPANAGSPKFMGTLAHEFQHMIHWEQKEHRYAVNDDTWLNEGMSEIAPVYCGYGPSYGRVLTFEKNPADSLTGWNSSVKDYGVVYMWAQYFKDRFEGNDPNIFYRMLHNDQAGTGAVNAALSQVDPSLSFAGTFGDWTIANYSGKSVVWPDRPEWSYRSIDTQAGTYDGVTLPGLFPEAKQNPSSSLAPLQMWSVDYFSFTPEAAGGTLTWTKANSSDRAVLIDPAAAIPAELVSGASYTINRRIFFIETNPAGVNAGTGATVIRTSAYPDETGIASRDPIGTDGPAAGSPKAMLEEANRDRDVQERANLKGESEAVCIHHYFNQKEKMRNANGARPRF